MIDLVEDIKNINMKAMKAKHTGTCFGGTERETKRERDRKRLGERERERERERRKEREIVWVTRKDIRVCGCMYVYKKGCLGVRCVSVGG